MGLLFLEIRCYSKSGGVRIGTAEIYRQVEQIEEVLEGLVVGQNWKDDTRLYFLLA